jgi:hypothetical protein
VVTAAYRRFVRRHHPDHGGDRSRFEAGVEAYRHLVGSRPPTGSLAAAGSPADVVFHRSRRRRLRSVLRLIRRRRPTRSLA